MRPDLRRRVTPALLTALGVAVLAGCSSRTESPSQFSAGDGSAAGTAVAVTVECPKVADALPSVRVSNAVRRTVARNLGVLEIQVADANRRLAQTVGDQNAAAAQQAVLTTLTNQRTVTIERIANALSGVTLPQNLADLAACTLRNGGTVDPAPTGSAAPTANPTDGAAPTETAAPTTGATPTDAPAAPGGDTTVPTQPAPDPSATAGAVELTVANAAAEPAPFRNPSATATAVPTATATQAPEATPSPTATGTASPSASATPTGTGTATPTPAPTGSRLLACPSVADQIVIPRDVRSAVALELGLMELQAATVNARLATTQSQADQDALLQRLAQERTRNLARIATLLDRSGGQVTGDLNSLAACELNNGGVLEDNGNNAGNGGGGAPAPSDTPAPADTATPADTAAPAPTGTATPAGTQAPGGDGSGGNGGAAGSGGNDGTGDGSGGDVWFEDSGTGH